MRLSLALHLLSSASAFSTVPSLTFATRRQQQQQQQQHQQQRREQQQQQQQQQQVAPLYGILEEVAGDAYDLTTSSTSKSGDIQMNDAYEMFLAELVFSTNDPRIDIANNIEKCVDEDWLNWLDNKVETSNDPEERVALRDLHSMIFDVKKRLDISKLAEQRKAEEAAEAEAARLAAAETEAEQGKKMSDADVLRKASAIDTATALDAETVEEKNQASFYDQELTPEIRLSYQDMLEKVLPPYPAGTTASSIVFNYYDQFDAQFVKVLSERARQGDEDSQALLTALAGEQQKRLAAATETLKEVLALGDPMRMEGALVRLAREGRINEPFLLLLEANATQARDAGALGPAQLMDRLQKRAVEEKDKQASSKEIRLLRQLLRTENAADREKLLEDAFTPKDSLIVPGTAENAQKAVDGELPEEQKPMPDVPPPDFINACKAVLLNFGNLETDDDRGDLATRIKSVAAEAEVVATRIYGEGMSVRDQQDMMWKDQTTSIFDLERMEIEAERWGEAAPWTNPDAPDDVIPGFDASGRMQIGGI